MHNWSLLLLLLHIPYISFVLVCLNVSLLLLTFSPLALSKVNASVILEGYLQRFLCGYLPVFLAHIAHLFHGTSSSFAQEVMHICFTYVPCVKCMGTFTIPSFTRLFVYLFMIILGCLPLYSLFTHLVYFTTPHCNLVEGYILSINHILKFFYERLIKCFSFFVSRSLSNNDYLYAFYQFQPMVTNDISSIGIVRK